MDPVRYRMLVQLMDRHRNLHKARVRMVMRCEYRNLQICRMGILNLEGELAAFLPKEIMNMDFLKMAEEK